MKKLLKVLSLALIFSMIFVGCGNKELTETESSKEGQTSSEAVETEESTAAESLVESTAEETESVSEELSEAEIQAAAIAEELQLDEELAVLLLEELQFMWEAAEGDKEKFASYAEMTKEEFARLAVKKTEETTEGSSIEINWVEEKLPTDRAWIDELYNELIEKDYQAVIELLYADDIMENAAPYAYVEYTYDAIGYKLVTSDGKYVGLILSNDGMSKDVWYSEKAETDYGFMYTQNGDIVVSTWDSGTGTRDYRWFDGVTIRDSYGSESTLEDGEAFAVWAM